MSTPSDRDLLKMTAARLREQADMLDQIAGEFGEMARLNEAIAWCTVQMAQADTEAGRAEEYFAYKDCHDKLQALRAGK